MSFAFLQNITAGNMVNTSIWKTLQSYDSFIEWPIPHDFENIFSFTIIYSFESFVKNENEKYTASQGEVAVV